MRGPNAARRWLSDAAFRLLAISHIVRGTPAVGGLKHD
jgi:hypothetical protein